MWADIGLLVLGAVCAGIGGESFVRGAVRTAAWLRVKPGLIGATVAAFATSAPELVVSITAALEGAPKIAIGNALGANALNLGLALGLALLIGPSEISQGGVRRDLPAVLAVPVLTGLFLVNGVLGRLEALVLIALFLAWLALSIRDEREAPEARLPMAAGDRWRALVYTIGGVAILLVAGESFVRGAVGISDAMGWDRFVVGATLVALGTTIPELSTSVIAKLRGQDEIGLGTILGSCIFNGAFIIPVAALITPPEIGVGEVTVALSAAVILVFAALPYGRRTLGRQRGLLLLAIYAAYVFALLALGGAD